MYLLVMIFAFGSGERVIIQCDLRQNGRRIRFIITYINNIHLCQHPYFVLIHCLDELRIPSTILKEEIAFIKQLQKWLGEKCKWDLCYRASRDGWSTQDFHNHCNHKGPTVLLIKANNCIFGGYNDKNWGGTVYIVMIYA